MSALAFHRHAAISAATVVALTSASAALAQYAFRELDTSGFPIAQVRDVANGMAVGYGVTSVDGSADQKALAWPLNSGAQHIDISHGFRSDALGVDNAGRIAGAVYFTTVLQSRPGFWPSRNDAPVDYSGNLNYGQGNATQPGQMIGWGHRLPGPDPVNDSAFIWNVPSQTRTPLPGPDGAAVSYGRNIDGIWAVGNASVPTTSGNVGAAAWDVSNLSTPRAINLHPAGFDYSDTSAVSKGKAVGLARQGAAESDFNHAYFWDLNTGAARDLHALLPASMHAVGSSATDLRGNVVVGSAMDAAGNLWGVSWNLATNTVTDLRQFLPAGTTFSAATAINDDGQIVGDYWLGSNDRNVYVLTPQRTNGDTDENGVINGADYARIDTTFNNEMTQGNLNGWANGDFNYDGKVDGSDYALIDAAFNAQSDTSPSVVPEPASAIILSLVAGIAQRRRNLR